MKILGNEIKPGMLIEHKDDLWEVLKAQHVKPGKGGAFNQVEMKSVNKNTKLNERFRSSDSVEKASLDEEKFPIILPHNKAGVFILNEDSIYAKLKEMELAEQLNYPPFSDIEKILGYYYERKIKTLTCCVEPKTHPYLVLFKKENQKGEQVVKHDLYRRQDYPECFEIRHFVCIFQVDEIQKLNSNMYNESTIFYKIDSDIDVDHENDLKEFLKSNTIKG